MRVVLLRRSARGEDGRDESLGSMKQKSKEGPPGLVDLGREQGYLTSTRSTISCLRTWPRHDLRAALESFETWISRSSRKSPPGARRD